MFRCIVFCLSLLVAPAWGAAPKNILVMGDSLSAGYGLPGGKSWPSLLSERLKSERPDYAVINASISGETTSGGRSRLPAALKQHKPAVVILELGANDGLRGLPLNRMEDNLTTMIRDSQATGARVLILGMRIPPNLGPDYSRRFHQTYGELAKTHKTALEPFFLERVAANPDMFLPDALHPTAEAQPIILDTVWPALKQLLK